MKKQPSKTQNLLHKTRQELEKIHRQYKINQEANRKADTRKKIELGGLIIKAGIQDLSRAEILGILLDAKEKLNGNERELHERRWLKIGRDEFDRSRN